MTGLSRPQPLGVLPLPAGWLVVPADVATRAEAADAVRRLLGGHLPTPWPAELEALRLAASGDVDEPHIRGVVPGPDPYRQGRCACARPAGPRLPDASLVHPHPNPPHRTSPGVGLLP